jgi:hypothetical protein
MLGVRTTGLKKTDAKDRNFKYISAHRFYHTQNNKISREFEIVNLEEKPQETHGE